MSVIQIVQKTPSDKLLDERDYRGFIVIEQDGKTAFSAYDGEPEDANLSRDFSDAFGVMDLMEEMYELGKAGVEVEFSSEEVDEDV